MTYDSAIPPSGDASTPEGDEAFESSAQGLADRQAPESFELTETDGGTARRTRYPRKRPARRRDVQQDQTENTEAIIADSHTEDSSLDELEALFGNADDPKTEQIDLIDDKATVVASPAEPIVEDHVEVSDDTVIMKAVQTSAPQNTPAEGLNVESVASAEQENSAESVHQLPSVDLPVYDRTAEHQPIPEDEDVVPLAEVPYFDAPARPGAPDRDVAAAVLAAAAAQGPANLDDEQAFDNYVESLFPSGQQTSAPAVSTHTVEEYAEPAGLGEAEHPVELSAEAALRNDDAVFKQESLAEQESLVEQVLTEEPVAAVAPRGRLDVEREDPNTSVQRARDRIPVIQSSPVVLSTQGLSKRFGATIAVNDINLQVRAGSFYGFVGPNGAGKTTTLSMVTGLLKPTAGSVVIQGADMWASSADAKRLVGALPDRLRLFDRLTGAQLLYYSGVLHGLDEATVNQRATELSAALGLENALGRLVSDYSAGMQKKIALATAMIHSPRILVLDEPFESIDPVSAATVTDILEKFVAGGGSVLISSHSIDLIQRVCDHVAVIVQGNVVAAGTVDEVRGGITLEERFTELTGATDTTEGLEWLHGFSG